MYECMYKGKYSKKYTHINEDTKLVYTYMSTRVQYSHVSKHSVRQNQCKTTQYDPYTHYIIIRYNI